MKHFRIITTQDEIDFAIEGKTIIVEGKTMRGTGDVWKDSQTVCETFMIRNFLSVVHIYDTDDLAYEAEVLSAKLHNEFSHWVLDDRAPMTTETLEWVSEQLSTLAEIMPELAEADLFYQYAGFINEVRDFLKIQHTYTPSKRYAEAKRLFDMGETVLKGE